MSDEEEYDFQQPDQFSEAISAVLSDSLTEQVIAAKNTTQTELSDVHLTILCLAALVGVFGNVIGKAKWFSPIVTAWGENIKTRPAERLAALEEEIALLRQERESNAAQGSETKET